LGYRITGDPTTVERNCSTVGNCKRWRRAIHYIQNTVGIG
jgi:hypothetical protein